MIIPDRAGVGPSHEQTWSVKLQLDLWLFKKRIFLIYPPKGGYSNFSLYAQKEKIVFD